MATASPRSSAAADRVRLDYVRDPDEIRRRSFARVRAEADLSRVPREARPVALRLAYAAGSVDLVADLVVSRGAVAAGRRAMRRGAPILVDARMVAAGIDRSRLPKGARVICTLGRAAAERRARAASMTRSAAAVELWRRHLSGAVVAIGNAPTALFRLLELLAEGWPRPALVIAMPVGFVGAAESKDALIERGDVPFIAVRGRRGGSALAAAAVNALAAGLAGPR